MPNITALIVVATVMFCVLGGVTLLAHIYNLNNIKSKTVGDGQHGTARFSTKAEIRRIYKRYHLHLMSGESRPRRTHFPICRRELSSAAETRAAILPLMWMTPISTA